MKTNKDNSLLRLTRKRKKARIFKEIHQEYAGQKLPYEKFNRIFTLKILGENIGMIEVILNNEGRTIQVVVKE